MEQRWRPEKGEKYWCVGGDMNPIVAVAGFDWAMDTLRFEAGNCFKDFHECFVMCNKLRAVLKGDDVIQMPSEDEMSQQAVDIAWKRQDDYCHEDGESVFCYGECYDSASDMYNWLKSKIIK